LIINLGNKPIKIYNLKRSVAEMYINDYNPVLLLIWKGNMDLQYIHDKSLILNRYITSYVTKSEKLALWEVKLCGKKLIKIKVCDHR
jgi:hypothetical protein